MRKNKKMVDYIDLLDEVSTAQCKLKLIKTVLEVAIGMIEKKEINTPEQTMLFINNLDVINDLLHISHDGVYFAIQTLDRLQKGGDRNE